MAFTPEQYGNQFISEKYCLAEIPDFQGLLPKAYDAGVPVFELTDREINERGTVLDGMKENRDRFLEQFTRVGDKIADLLGHA